MRLRVLLAGREAAGAQILRAVAATDHELVAVLTQEPSEKGGSASLSGVAERLGVEVLPARLVRDPAFASQLRDWSIDILLNAHSLHVVADEVLKAPAIGSFNLHPGPLPEYAGLNTVGWAIHNGETEYGVTVHWMAPRIDAGPIAFEERFPMPEHASALTLSAECTRRGVALMVSVLDRAAADPCSVPAIPQDAGLRTYYPKGRIPQGGRIDWTRSAAEIDRFARAFDYGPFVSPWGRPFMLIGDERFDVVGLGRSGRSTTEVPGTPRIDEDGLHVASADEWITLGRILREGVVMDRGALFERLRAQRETGVVR